MLPGELPIEDLLGAEQLGCVVIRPEVLAAGVRGVQARGQDWLREALERGLRPSSGPRIVRRQVPVPSNRHELPTRVYAPASECVPKPPAPGDERFVHRSAQTSVESQSEPLSLPVCV